MKRHGRWMTLLIVALTAGGMAQSVYAQSTNRMTRVVTVGENTLLQTENHTEDVPVLVITLEDALTQGSRFYLKLENAKWEKAVAISLTGSESAKIKTQMLSETELEVILEEGTLGAESVIRIPMATTVTKGEAKVILDHNNTSLASGTLTFANTSTARGNITVDEVPKAPEGGVIAPITIEEAYADQFKNERAQQGDSLVTLTVQEEGYEWDEASLAKATLTGCKSFEGIKGDQANFKKTGPQTLQVQLPEAIGEMSRSGKGAIQIKGLAIKKAEQAKQGHVNVRVEGEMITPGVYPVFACQDYEVTLTCNGPVKVSTGEQVSLSFALEENMPGALLKDRSLDVTLSGGELPLDGEGKVSVAIGDQSYTYPPILEDGKCIGFEMNNLGEASLKDQLKYNMKVAVKVPAGMQAQQLTLSLSGRGLPRGEDVAARVAEVIPKVRLEAEQIQLKEGMRDQVGGRVTLTEVQAGVFEEGEVITLNYLQDEMRLAKLPVIEVVSGDLKLGEVRAVEGGIEIPIQRASKTASQIEIKHFGVHTSGAIADGYYDLKVGGSAITQFEGDGLTLSDWILVNVAPKGRRQITFKLGEEAYNLNGKYYHVEVPAYLQEGRVMVPLKYVVESLGIDENQVKWDKATQKITIYDQHVIELELGSTIMKVDGEKVYMPVATQSKNGFTMVPMSELAKALEVEITWNEKLQTATFVAQRA